MSSIPTESKTKDSSEIIQSPSDINWTNNYVTVIAFEPQEQTSVRHIKKQRSGWRKNQLENIVNYKIKCWMRYKKNLSSQCNVVSSSYSSSSVTPLTVAFKHSDVRSNLIDNSWSPTHCFLDHSESFFPFLSQMWIIYVNGAKEYCSFGQDIKMTRLHKDQLREINAIEFSHIRHGWDELKQRQYSQAELVHHLGPPARKEKMANIVSNCLNQVVRPLINFSQTGVLELQENTLDNDLCFVGNEIDSVLSRSDDWANRVYNRRLRRRILNPKKKQKRKQKRKNNANLNYNSDDEDDGGDENKEEKEEKDEKDKKDKKDNNDDEIVEHQTIRQPQTPEEIKQGVKGLARQTRNMMDILRDLVGQCESMTKQKWNQDLEDAISSKDQATLCSTMWDYIKRFHGKDQDGICVRIGSMYRRALVNRDFNPRNSHKKDNIWWGELSKDYVFVNVSVSHPPCSNSLRFQNEKKDDDPNSERNVAKAVSRAFYNFLGKHRASVEAELWISTCDEFGPDGLPQIQMRILHDYVHMMVYHPEPLDAKDDVAASAYEAEELMDRMSERNILPTEIPRDVYRIATSYLDPTHKPLEESDRITTGERNRIRDQFYQVPNEPLNTKNSKKRKRV